MLTGPVHVLFVANLQQQIELLGKERVVVLEAIAEERERFDGRPSPHHHLGASLRQEIERRELLKDTNRVGGAQHRDRARQPNATRACRSGAEDDGRRGIQVFLTMVLADPEDIKTDLVRMLDLLDQVAQSF